MGVLYRRSGLQRRVESLRVLMERFDNAYDAGDLDAAEEAAAWIERRAASIRLVLGDTRRALAERREG